MIVDAYFKLLSFSAYMGTRQECRSVRYSAHHGSAVQIETTHLLIVNPTRVSNDAQFKSAILQKARVRRRATSGASTVAYPLEHAWTVLGAVYSGLQHRRRPPAAAPSPVRGGHPST